MRSYWALLCHILGSHPEIAGYAEMHLAYRHGMDLLRLRSRVSPSLGAALGGRFVLDKVLHDDYLIAPSILGRKDVYSIVLVSQADGDNSEHHRPGREDPVGLVVVRCGARRRLLHEASSHEAEEVRRCPRSSAFWSSDTR